MGFDLQRWASEHALEPDPDYFLPQKEGLLRRFWYRVEMTGHVDWVIARIRYGFLLVEPRGKLQVIGRGISDHLVTLVFWTLIAHVGYLALLFILFETGLYFLIMLIPPVAMIVVAGLLSLVLLVAAGQNLLHEVLLRPRLEEELSLSALAVLMMFRAQLVEDVTVECPARKTPGGGRNRWYYSGDPFRSWLVQMGLEHDRRLEIFFDAQFRRKHEDSEEIVPRLFLRLTRPNEEGEEEVLEQERFLELLIDEEAEFGYDASALPSALEHHITNFFVDHELDLPPRPGPPTNPRELGGEALLHKLIYWGPCGLLMLVNMAAWAFYLKGGRFGLFKELGLGQVLNEWLQYEAFLMLMTTFIFCSATIVVGLRHDGCSRLKALPLPPP